MGLDCYLRNIPKNTLEDAAKARCCSLPQAALVVPKAHYSRYELAYWRGHRDLNRWMRDLYNEKYVGEHGDQYLPGSLSVILDITDLLSLKMEMTFGSLGESTTRWRWGDEIFALDADLAAIDRAMRITHNSRSYVYYISSW